MAGAGYKLFNTGDVLTAAQVNTYLMEQSVMVFANAAARTTALSGVVAEGMLSYLKDTDAVEVYNGSAWVASDDPNAIQNTIVDAKGDLIAASANDTPARLAVGNNGETLLADSAATTGLRWQGNYAAGKNAIINGDFRIWQRGTSFTNLATGLYSADRWSVTTSNNTIDVSQSSFTAGTAPVAGYEGLYFATVAAEATDTDARFQQRVEDVRVFAGQTITVSFWAKSTITTDAVKIRVQQNFGSGGSSSVNNDSSTFTLTSSWARYSATFSLASISGKTIGTSNYLGIYFMLKASTAQTFDVWGVQVEAGSVATPFQTATATLAGELAACQRYYFRNSANATDTYAYFGQGFTNTTTNGRILVQVPVTMRTKPTSVDFANLGIQEQFSGTIYAVSAISIGGDGGGPNPVFINATCATATGTKYAVILSNASSTGYLGFSAEL